MYILLNSDPDHDRIITNACADLVNRHYDTYPPTIEHPWEVLKSWWMNDYNAELHDPDNESCRGVSFKEEKDYLMFILKFDKPLELS